MQLLRIILTVLAVAFAGIAYAAEQAAPVAGAGAEAVVHDAASGAHDAHGKAEQKGLPPAAPIAFQIGWFQVTSSMVITWAVAALIILVAQLATRKVQLVPSGLQGFVEMIVEGLYGFFEEIVGKHMIKKSFWFFSTLFIFILVTNWFGLIPGVGTIGWGTPDASGHLHHISRPILRGGNADLNMTLAMALVYFFLWAVWSWQSLGPIGVVKHLFSSGAKGKDFMTLFIAAIFIVVGLIEIVSILFRPVSLTFRLYGNIFAGENILESMMGLVPWLGWILPLPFYFLELLVGLVQALVFALLTSVFTALMCEDHDESHGEHKQAAH